MTAIVIQSDEQKSVEITKNTCGSKNYLHPHRHLRHKTAKSEKPTRTYVSVFSCFPPHLLTNFPPFRLHEVATLMTALMFN